MRPLHFDSQVVRSKSVTSGMRLSKYLIEWVLYRRLRSCEQSTSETATYGSEFLSGRTCFEQSIEHRNYLRYLGVPVHNISYAWGDNDAMINSVTLPDAKLHKRHNILSFHFVCNILAAKFINLQHLSLQFNIADIVSKHWSYQSVYANILRPTFTLKEILVTFLKTIL